MLLGSLRLLDVEVNHLGGRGKFNLLVAELFEQAEIYLMLHIHSLGRPSQQSRPGELVKSQTSWRIFQSFANPSLKAAELKLSLCY